jgi:uncharacterized protein
MMHDFTIQNNHEASQFEAHSGDEVAYLQYELSNDQISLLHTEVPASMEGKGIASALAKTGLEFARTNNLYVIPQCEFVQGYIQRHPEYQDLVRSPQENAPQ